MLKQHPLYHSKMSLKHFGMYSALKTVSKDKAKERWGGQEKLCSNLHKLLKELHAQLHLQIANLVC